MITINFNSVNNFLNITYGANSNLSINQNMSIDCHNVTAEQVEQAYSIYKLLTS